MKLTIEQEFAVAAFTRKVSDLTEEQAKKILVEMFEANLQKDNQLKELITHHWFGGTR